VGRVSAAGLNERNTCGELVLLRVGDEVHGGVMFVDIGPHLAGVLDAVLGGLGRRGSWVQLVLAVA